MTAAQRSIEATGARPIRSLAHHRSTTLWAALVATLTVGAGLGSEPHRAVWFALVFGLLATFSFLDLRDRRVPNTIVYPAVGFGLVVPLFAGLDATLVALEGGVISFALMLALAIASRGAMGMADVKVAALCGLLLGPVAALAMLALASILAAVVGLALLLTRRVGLRDALPLVPFLSFATLLFAVLEGGPV